MFPKRYDQLAGQHGNAVLHPFGVVDVQFFLGEVDILDPQGEALADPHSAPVKQFDDESVFAFQFVDDGKHFLSGQNDRTSCRAFGTRDSDPVFEFDFEHVFVEKQDGCKGLILSRGGDVSLRGQMAQKRLNFRCAHILWVAFVMEEDKSFDPGQVRIFGSAGVVLRAQNTVYPFEQGNGYFIHELEFPFYKTGLPVYWVSSTPSQGGTGTTNNFSSGTIVGAAGGISNFSGNLLVFSCFWTALRSLKGAIFRSN